MNFMDAVQLIRNGRRVARSGWKNKYIFIREPYPDPEANGNRLIRLGWKMRPSGKENSVPAELTANDYLATDWAEVDEPEGLSDEDLLDRYLGAERAIALKQEILRRMQRPAE